MKLEITQEDIDQGRRRDSCHCPVANALGRCVPGEVWQVLPFNGVFFGTELRFKLTFGAMCFICLFDNGFPVRPKTIELKEVSRAT